MKKKMYRKKFWVHLDSQSEKQDTIGWEERTET